MVSHAGNGTPKGQSPRSRDAGTLFVCFYWDCSHSGKTHFTQRRWHDKWEYQ